MKKIILMSLVASSLMFAKQVEVFSESELINSSIILDFAEENKEKVLLEDKNIKDINALYERINREILVEAKKGGKTVAIEIFELDEKVRKSFKNVYYKPILEKLDRDLRENGYEFTITVEKGQRLRETFVLNLTWKDEKEKIKPNRNKQDLDSYLEHFKLK